MEYKKKVLGTVSEEETMQIQDLFEKKMALENLINIIDPSNEVLFEKVMKEYRDCFFAFNNWWSDMSKKYQWSGKNWQIDFESHEIFINEC